MSVSVMSSRNSVEQDEALVELMHRTPKAPIKVRMQTPSSAHRRRSLFRKDSTDNTSDDSLGVMSPLSSSVESLQSLNSTSFSPNGHLKSPSSYRIMETPTKTPSRSEVRSSLFPNAKSYSPSVRRSPRSSQPVRVSPNTKKTMALLEQVIDTTPMSSSQLTNMGFSQSVRRSPRSSQPVRASPNTKKTMALLEDVINATPMGSSQVTNLSFSPSVRRSPRSSPNTKKTMALLENVIDATPVSCSQVTTSRSSRRRVRQEIAETSPSSLTSTPQRFTKVIPDSAEKKEESSIVSPISVESFYGPPRPISNFTKAPRAPLIFDTVSIGGARKYAEMLKRNFISVGTMKRKRSSSRSRSRSRKPRKGPIPGVWHNVKPKKIKKNAPKPKPDISPSTRVAKTSTVKVMKTSVARPLFESKPRRRIAGKRSNSKHSNDIIDSFPEPLIKRKKLPSSPVKESEPDPTKKFLKHGSFRKATFTLHDNVRLEFKNGEMRVKSPKKLRPVRSKKLFVATNDLMDFNEPEDQANDPITNSVKNILQDLDNEPIHPQTPVQIEKISDEQLMSILDNPATKVTFIEASPGKTNVTEIHSSPQRSLLRNLSNLAIQELNSETVLGNTGHMVSAAANLLNDGDGLYDPSPGAHESPDGEMYPVFDKENWSASIPSSKTSPKERRRNLLKEDQYLLDAGQNSIGIVKCRECGVMYQQGDYLDEVAHNNVHNHLTELRFLGWKDERIVSRFADGRVVMVTAADPKPWQQKALKVVGVVDLELGFSENSLKWTPDKKVYMYVNDKQKQVVGCLVSENCQQGYRMYPTIDGVDIDTCSRDPTPCKLGVSRVWTSLPHRRKGVASRLFGCARRLAGDANQDDIAFSIPSPAGKLLARSVIGREDFKVYGFLSD